MAEAVAQHMVASAHDCSASRLAVTLSECCFAQEGLGTVGDDWLWLGRSGRTLVDLPMAQFNEAWHDLERTCGRGAPQGARELHLRRLRGPVCDRILEEDGGIC